MSDDAPVSEGDDVLAHYKELYLQNEHLVGWLSIAGTTINYPVMQTVDSPNYYLKRNFEKEYSDLGTPYVQENCDISQSDNLVIYNHHIKGGKMFGALENYKSKSFYEEHKSIQFDTLTQQGEYEIVAVFKIVAYSSEGFRYYDFVDAADEEAFNAYIAKCKELALSLIFNSLKMPYIVINDIGKLFSCHSSGDTGFLNILSYRCKIEVKVVVSFVHKLTTLYQ